MLSDPFRPWGLFPWVISKLKPRKWDILGCISTEERCQSIAHHCGKNRLINRMQFIKVVDPDSRWQDITEQKCQNNLSEIKKLHPCTVNTMGLLESPVKLKKMIKDFISITGGNVVVDISSFPKRFFFPILKLLMFSDKVDNLLVTYSLPEQYYPGSLSEDPLPWSFIPMFQRTDHPPAAVKNAVIGVGFLPFGLPELLKNDYRDADVSLIFPFPPGPPNYQRTWEFVRKIEKFYPLQNERQIIRVDVLDMPGCYQHITSLSSNDKKSTIFAPYGPKSHTLAMCLFAAKYDCDVYYTQPQVYHPEYCTGMKMINGTPETYAYCIKVNGTHLY